MEDSAPFVLVLGVSHLPRIQRVHMFPSNFTVIGLPGVKTQCWEFHKDEIRENHILIVLMGGNNVTAKPSDPEQCKQFLKETTDSFLQLRNFCIFAETSLIICKVFNRKRSRESKFDVIDKLNGRLKNKGMKPHFRAFSFEEMLSNDNVHLTTACYEAAGAEILSFFANAPIVLPELVDLKLENVV